MIGFLYGYVSVWMEDGETDCFLNCGAVSVDELSSIIKVAED